MLHNNFHFHLIEGVAGWFLRVVVLALWEKANIQSVPFGEFRTRKAQNMFIASVRRLSVCLSVCLTKPKFGRLKSKFDDDADNACEGSSKRTRPHVLHVFYLVTTSIGDVFIKYIGCAQLSRTTGYQRQNNL